MWEHRARDLNPVCAYVGFFSRLPFSLSVWMWMVDPEAGANLTALVFVVVLGFCSGRLIGFLLSLLRDPYLDVIELSEAARRPEYIALHRSTRPAWKCCGSAPWPAVTGSNSRHFKELQRLALRLISALFHLQPDTSHDTGSCQTQTHVRCTGNTDHLP